MSGQNVGGGRPPDDAGRASETGPLQTQTTVAVAADDWVADRPDIGTRMARYELRSVVGAGGLGVVFKAHDPELDRTVAVKILRSRSGGGSAGELRLRREGQTMARLAHPNVIRVYDVGVANDRVFIAMEFIDGRTLGRWLEETPRSPGEVIAAFARAGRGLAAVHEAGLIHRDFKPSNVLVGHDGRVLVTDFGLARAAGEDPVDGSGEAGIASPVAIVTATGAVVGTPAFMAPEQMSGSAVDARADQFSFCVALWCALFGSVPYAGSSVDELASTIARGALTPPSPEAAALVGDTVRAALERGLDPVPGDRFGSMAELIDALEAISATTHPATPCHNLPHQHTRFIGRDEALADLARLLPESRVLTLTGIGGCGKTRLALQLAREQLAAFPDGVWFIDLSLVTHADRVVSTCAAVLGIREDGDAPLLDRLIRHLAARRALLVLDNCEHVLSGAVRLIDALLVGAASTAILATSREALGTHGEQIYPVRSLSLPATEDLDAVLGAESVRVFVDRARLVVPDFAVDAGNAAPVAEICRRLDGIALAIELAAARVTMLSAAQIVERLDDRFRLLTGRNHTLPRHETLAAAMAWSYEQLAPAAQRMLRQVSVFVGGWSLGAAADVAQTADEHEALALLTALHDKSLLVVDRAASGDRPRYRLLETVRQYALDRLSEQGEAEAARGRHVEHYVHLAEAAASRLQGPEQGAWLDRLHREQENLIAALTWCSEGRVDPQAGLRLAAATCFYWSWNSLELGQRLAVAVLERDSSAADTPARAATLVGIARLSLNRGRYQESLAYSRQAVAVARRIGDPRSLAPALSNLGGALNTLGLLDEARQCNEEVLELARQLDDAKLMSSVLNSIAESRRAAGELDAAEQSYREALDLSRAHSGGLSTIVVINNLIRVQVARGRLDDARRLARECLPMVIGERVGVDLLEATVGLAAASGDLERAARFWGAANQTLLGWGYRHQPVDLAHVTPLLAGARSALGDAAYSAAESAGRALDFDAAMAELADWLGRDKA